jgi:protein-tyrosine phosphatase
MRTQLYWIGGPWPGRLAIAARPRGDDWLDEEATNWRRSGIDLVVSLLTSEEETELGLAGEANAVMAAEMKFISFPINDRDVPRSEMDFGRLLTTAESALASGNNVLVHCRQGIGRAGLVAAGLLITSGENPERAVREIASVRGVPVPETAQQRVWLDHYAASLTPARQR